MIQDMVADEALARERSRKQLGRLLVDQGIITSGELSRTLTVQAEHGGRLGDILVQQGLVGYEALLQVLSVQLSVPVVDVRGRRVSREALAMIPEAMARQHFVVPLEVSEGRLFVAMAYPDDIGIMNDIKTMTAARLEIAISSPVDIEQAINLNYRSSAELEEQIGQFEATEERHRARTTESIADTPAAHSLHMIVKQAVQDRASDVHLEPQEDVLRVRYRIDGLLHDMYTLPLSAHLPLLSRLKILGDINIAEQRRPQDGHFSTVVGGRNVDVRVATVGTLHGERATLRIFDKSLPLLTLEQLGFLPEAMEQFHTMLKSTFGMILVSGPTGSGKTTTLYAAVNHMRHDERNIMTVEDPVEYRFSGISQIQVNAKAGISFSSGLRAIVRQDPDAILIGEIRDQETAKTAVQAALTGHLVLASIHANDSVSTLYRLVDLGIDPYLITSTVVGMIAQRMVRRVCSRCSDLVQPSAEEQAAYFELMEEEAPIHHVGKGCAVCANSGYFGRTGIFELLCMNDDIRDHLLKGSSAAEVRAQALTHGMTTMGHDGMTKAKQGITSIMECLRCIYSLN